MTPGRPLTVATRSVKSARHHASGRLRVASTRNRGDAVGAVDRSCAARTLPPPSVTTRASLARSLRQSIAITRLELPP